MKNTFLSQEDALKLCQRVEDHFFDRKAFGISGAKIQKIAVAFANADGGEFVIGIADDHNEPDPQKRWNGASNIEEFNGYIQALTEIKPSLPLSYSFLTCKEKPGIVLLVEVEKSASVHSTSDNTVYQRISAQSLPVREPEKLIGLTYAKGSTSYEEQILPTVLCETIVEGRELKNFLGDYSPKTDPLDFVVSQNLIDLKTWDAKVAGVLLFCDCPSNFIPKKCAVKIARYETREDTPEREHLKDQHTVEGALYPLIHETIDIISNIMSSVRIWTVDGLKNVTYPPEAIWEIVVNAIIHRDYSISDDIHVHIFDNRIEVLSPGRLPGYVTIDNILDSRYSRNPKIVRTLNRYKSAPNKDMGEGLNTAFQKMKEWRLQNPTIEEEENYVKVTISHTPLASPEEAILEFLKQNETIRNSQARDITGIRSENSVKNVFYRLRDQGYIERVPGLEGSASMWQKKKKN